MKFVRRTSSLLLLALTTAACATEDGSAPTDGLDSPRETVDQTGVVCNERYAIGLAPSCDVGVSGWTGTSLFGAGAPGVLGQYCAFTRSGTSTLKALAGQVPDVAADCQAVSVQGEIITDTINDELDAYFGWLTGRLEDGALAASYPNATQSPVRVAVVDTYPVAEPGNPISHHGPFVMSIVEGLACDGPTCAIDTKAHLGLPRTQNGSNWSRGGYLGRQSDLARGIYEAVEASQNAGGHLVINLSVGWESELFGGTGPANMPPPVRATYDAIRLARCKGALIIASAGNHSGLTDDEVALAPARWEGIPAPTRAECTEVGVPMQEAFVDGAAYTPLVHAIGGLYGPNSEMVTGRELGMPRLAAAASHAVAQPRAVGLDDVTVETGTSVSAAVASAAASLVWSLRPGLSPSEVMAGLYGSGVPTTLTSDFGGQALPVHRIDICHAVEAALGPAAPNPELGCDTSAPVTTHDLVTELALLFDGLHKPEFEPAEPCGDVMFYPGPGEVRDCTAVEPDPWSILTSPQPPRPGCSDCVLTTSTEKPTAILALDEAFDVNDLLLVDIEITEESGDVHRFSLKEEDIAGFIVVIQLKTHEVEHVELPIDLEGIKPLRAMVFMEFKGDVHTEDALLID